MRDAAACTMSASGGLPPFTNVKGAGESGALLEQPVTFPKHAQKR